MQEYCYSLSLSLSITDFLVKIIYVIIGTIIQIAANNGIVIADGRIVNL